MEKEATVQEISPSKAFLRTMSSTAREKKLEVITISRESMSMEPRKKEF